VRDQVSLHDRPDVGLEAFMTELKQSIHNLSVPSDAGRPSSSNVEDVLLLTSYGRNM